MRASQQGVKRWKDCVKCEKRAMIEYGSSFCDECGLENAKLFHKVMMRSFK